MPKEGVVDPSPTIRIGAASISIPDVMADAHPWFGLVFSLGIILSGFEGFASETSNNTFCLIQGTMKSSHSSTFPMTAAAI
jgi:hypothetical protein